MTADEAEALKLGDRVRIVNSTAKNMALRNGNVYVIRSVERMDEKFCWVYTVTFNVGAIVKTGALSKAKGLRLPNEWLEKVTEVA